MNVVVLASKLKVGDIVKQDDPGGWEPLYLILNVENTGKAHIKSVSQSLT